MGRKFSATFIVIWASGEVPIGKKQGVCFTCVSVVDLKTAVPYIVDKDTEREENVRNFLCFLTILANAGAELTKGNEIVGFLNDSILLDMQLVQTDNE